MYKRHLTIQEHSFFLFGPRGTGKSSWLKSEYRDALRFDFLQNEVLLRYLGTPSRLRQEIINLPTGSWVVLDEVQKIPALLDEVHFIIQERGDEVRFCLSGSSARKLRGNDANLLAGRAIQRAMFPLTRNELGSDFNLEERLKFGSLPLVCAKPDISANTLESYVGTYLREEIQQEALARNLDSFTRFLKVASLMNGQLVNIAGIARDAGVPRASVERYFSVLVDTLIGAWLPGWQPRLKVREKHNPKFYFFDCGVVRTLLGTLREPLESAERGHLLETYIFHELRSAMSYLDIGGECSYYRTPAGVEVDFIWSRGKNAVGIEVKSAIEWRPEYSKGLHDLLESGGIHKAIGVYRGTRKFNDGKISILPVEEFCDQLAQGKVLT